MRRLVSFLTVSGLCLALCTAAATAQDKPREKKLPTPPSAADLATARKQSKEILTLFRETCINLAGDTETIVAQSLVAGMKELLAADTPKPRDEPDNETRNLKKYANNQQIGLRLESNPWKCTVYGEGALEKAIIKGANNLYQEFYSDPAYSNLEATNLPDKKDFDKTHSFITVDRDDGAHYKFRFTYGGLAPDRVILTLTYTPPRERKQLSEYLALELGPENMNLPSAQRNSKIAMVILKNACIAHFDDFKALSRWAAGHLSEDDEFVINETRGTWIAEDKDVSIMLNAAQEKHTTCKIHGGSVDANLLHQEFQDMLTDHTKEPGQSIAANQYSTIKYKDAPNDMPEAMPYYSGGVLRIKKQETGIDIVLSTKRKGDEITFNIDVKPTSGR